MATSEKAPPGGLRQPNDSPRARVRHLIVGMQESGYDRDTIIAAAQDEFMDDPFVVAWALRWATIWLFAGANDDAREAIARRALAGAPAAEVFGVFEEKWMARHDLARLAGMNRLQILAQVQEEERQVRGMVRRITVERMIADALPNDHITAGTFFKRNQGKLRQIIATAYADEGGEV